MTGDGYAPKWVQSVTPAEIVRQRQIGWVDFHPEDFCHVCGHRNPCWSTGGDWDVVFPGHNGIVCPTCFATLYADAIGSDRVVWEFRTIFVNGERCVASPADQQSLAEIGRKAQASADSAKAEREDDSGCMEKFEAGTCWGNQYAMETVVEWVNEALS